MALVVKDRVQEITGTTGTGTVTLGGAVLGYQSFSTVGNGNTTYYTIVDLTAGDWEVGIGTYNSATPSLSRDTVLSSSNAGSLVPFAAGTKNVFVTYPSERSVYLDSPGSYPVQSTFNTLNATTATLTAGTVSTTPSAGTDLANKSYVDTVAAAGIHYHAPVYVESPNTAGNLNAAYNQPGGPGVGVGATLTNAGTKAALTIDGVLMTTTKRVLIYNQTNAYENGVYTVTTVGTPDPGGTNWVLTRATDADTYAPSSPNSLGQGDAFFVTNGDTGAGEGYVCTTVGVITFGTTAITFSQFSAAQVYNAGTGLNLSPSTTFNISNTGVTAATYGSASQVPVFAVNAQGQITSVTNTAIAIAAGAVSGLAASATTDTTNAANITSGTLPTGRLSGSYTGITGVGTLAAGTWNGSVIGPVYGGTGFGTYAVGDLLYADTTTSLAKLADVAVGNALISGGVGSAPSWGKIGMATHVSGILPVANGGTGVTSSTGTGAVVLSDSPSLVTPILGTPQSGNFSTGTFTWPTFNQNTTGNAATATTATTATTANALNTANGYTGISFTASTATDGYFYANRGATAYQAGIQFRTAGTTNWYNFLDNNVNTLTWYQTNTNTQVMSLTQAGVLNVVGNITLGGSQVLTAGNYNSYAPTLTGTGASGTWGINVTGNAATATTASNSTNLGGYAASTYVGKFGNTYYQTDTWIQCNTLGGLYWPAINTAELNANTASSYGAIAIIGSRNTWRGIHFQGGGNQPHLMFDGSANGGIYFESGGRWASYYLYANNCWGFGTSTTNSAYNIYCSTGIYSGGRVDGTIFYDANDTGYYLDPNSTSDSALRIRGGALHGPNVTWGAYLAVGTNGNTNTAYCSVATTNGNLHIDAASGYDTYLNYYAGSNVYFGNGATGGIFARIANDGSFRSPIFYDYNNTGYYGDFAGTSNLFDLQITGASNKYLYINPGNGYEAMVRYNGGSGSGWYVGKRNASVLVGTESFHFYSEAAAATVAGIDTSGNIFASGSMRAPIFYDSNNTGYYLDPNGTSQLSYVLANDWFRPQGNTGLYFQSYGYGIWAPEAAGNTYGNVATYGSGRNGWMGYAIGSRHVFMSTGGDNVGVHDNSRGFIWYWNGSYFAIDFGFTQIAGSVRSPLFYDSDNTNYYVNPAGTSVLNGLTVGGGTIATTSGSPSYYMARAWVKFNAGGSIYSQVNVSSVTYNGTGDYTVNFATSMPDADYVATGFARIDTGGGADFPIVGAYRANTYLAGSLRVATVFRSSATNTGTLQSPDITGVVIFR